MGDNSNPLPGEEVFAPGVGPAEPNKYEVIDDGLPHVTPFSPTLEEVLDEIPKKEPESEDETKPSKAPEYMERENAKALYDQELQNGTPLSPLSVMYYLSKDSDDRNDKANIDLRGALEEQGKIIKLYMSKTKLSPIEWETALQNPAGWKEIKQAIGEDHFLEKTGKYLAVKGFDAMLKKDNNLRNVLFKTAELIKPNLSNPSNGA